MKKSTYQFTNATVDYYFDSSIDHLKSITNLDNIVIVTDETIYNLYESKLNIYRTIVVPAGEKHKHQETINYIIQQLISYEADRKSILVGIGGGVITDMTGYAASIYMRGIAFGFVPTTLLAMVDASIGGKNGIDVGIYKNMVGIIRQPQFLLYDVSLLNTLSQADWSNGFAEIIKHAAIKDAILFSHLEKHQISDFQSDKKLLSDLVTRNALIKTVVVQEDEHEKGDRKLLNFGHTLGHAIENEYHLFHGQAIAIGMAYASRMSQQIVGFDDSDRLINLLEKYGLPTKLQFNKQRALEVLSMDKKRDKNSINYILLKEIGKGIIQKISLEQINTIIESI